MKIAVLGAGAWGTALASAAARGGHDVLLWARDAAQARQIDSMRCNTRYLPGVALPPELTVTADAAQAFDHSAEADSLIVIATPMAALRPTLQAVPAGRAVLWLCKGFEAGGGSLAHEIARELRSGAACGVLSGPSFALEVAQGLPTALVAASTDSALTAAAVAAFHSETLRVYTSSDIVGVEVGGAVKNVLAIATGIVDGMPAAGLNARAALITRGLAEMTRLGTALGARAETFMGLSGLGDLVLTATGELSRNRKVGLALAGGHSLADVLQQLGHVAEGALSAPTVLQRAQAQGVEMPITAAVVAVLQGRLAPVQVMAALMSREARSEYDNR
ncbi:MAG: NAD(P)-dependent glycerol-3-phosphate dehydrogenase [Rubrivivax sp.]|nr:NAD(P)-dependent glycerol-3-phosphate dehydrogenase [Rubrivivax sp.]